ncbi:TATA box-binding protein-associated factor RNA polymerase I subunit A isoform X2 [Gouania willdenowi]|uniref:TATA box-binding protein-associated factor RNA polymerase I subunit A isoform X2 n=1 Tax=Gouania willdenowi TaxID=441366 RepID=UPI0010554043|nr:TATA box-binding protein-associated factor RNA polymerase I subunit A isoform X2 [Gouania willdenowi]XP_028296128.1 TATA box-binding protein-associated factor RNA polymerase I subunit A isoform X2 [Gouania willdenowi]
MIPRMIIYLKEEGSHISLWLISKLQLVWRISTEILHHLPNSTMDDYNIIYERMKHSGVRHYLTICLEKSFHLMLHGELENARRELSAGESWRYGKESASQHHNFTLIHAYRSLLDYIIWCDKKSLQSTHPNSEDDQSMHRYFKQAAVNLREVLKKPGVWDPFILCYIEMLEFYDDHEEALKILNNYAYDHSFPPNPNAHVYLYQYLKRHNAPEKKLIKVLKILQVLVPSHELMLEYISLLLQSERTNAVQKALEVALAMLDFKCWKRNLDVWRHLKAIIQQMQTQENCQEAVVAVMDQRKDWWSAFHFTSMHATQDVKDNPELFEIKSSLAKVLYPDQTLKYTAGS